MIEDKNKMNQTSPECSVPKNPEIDNPNKEGWCSPEFPSGCILEEEKKVDDCD